MKYELLYIVPTQYTDAEVETIKGTVAGFIETAAGKISRHEILGKLKLAYPIKRVRHGSYVLAQFDAEPAAVKNIDRQLRLTNEVLRHQMILLPPLAESHAFQMISYVAPLSEEGRADEGRPERRPSPTSSPAPVAPVMKREESNMTMEELDKKLDQILETDDKV